MNKISYILTVSLSLLSVSALAQIDADIIRPSVNAEQFGLSVKAEAALNKGQLSLSIPLMTLKGKGYDLPISLTFYSGDVTPSTEASSVGLGWALMAGGVITTTIRGADDIESYIGGWTTEHQTDSDFVVNGAYNAVTNGFDFIDDIQHDPMPDEYTYSLPGHGGTIEVSIDGNIVNRTLFPDESYKIEKNTGGYCITADDGTKFYFETPEYRITGTWPENTVSTSWFLTRIVTTKGGEFTFHYSEEEYIDLSSTRDLNPDCFTYRTQRIDSIHSEFGTVTFNAVNRNDRGSIGNQTITSGMESKRINQIVLKDENGSLVKGYELDNSNYFKLHEDANEEPDNSWYNYRLKLSSITQYDSAGNRLPPYRFSYDYRLSKSIFAYTLLETEPDGSYSPYDSWTSNSGTQVYVDLYGGSNGSTPYCSIGYNLPNSSPIGWTTSSGQGGGTTAGDYFCLDSIYYPNGAIDEFCYESHDYGKINNTNDTYDTNIQGRRLASKIHSGSDINQRTDYVYKLHNANYNATDSTSGVLTNPSIHSATYYTPELGDDRLLHASRITSGKPFNSFMGPPVCYTEVEEVEKDKYSHVLNRTIHYFEPQIVSPPVNYVLVKSFPATLSRIENRIFGRILGYSNGMEGCNNLNYTYLAYPVAEFYNTASVVDKPLKEVFVGKDGRVRTIKDYYYTDDNLLANKKYGYRIVTPENSNYSLISRSEYISRRTRLSGTQTTSYYYDGVSCDSICEEYHISYNKGRTGYTNYYYGFGNARESKATNCYYPGDIPNIVGNNSSPELAAINGLIDKNMVADPIKTVVKRNDKIIDGECKDYQMVSGEPLLKSIYKLKKTDQNYSSVPTINGNDINYRADLYEEGEVMAYDEYHNPMYVKLNNTIDRIYVWGYGGRFPIAVIDNMDYTTFLASTNLRSELSQLATYRKIESATDCTNLRNLNAGIRSLLPNSVHITTYTYDPYFGMTSEIDDSNLGTIYTYDTFGRITAKYNVNYKKLEEYNYHLKLQQ